MVTFSSYSGYTPSPVKPVTLNYTPYVAPAPAPAPAPKPAPTNYTPAYYTPSSGGYTPAPAPAPEPLNYTPANFTPATPSPAPTVSSAPVASAPTLNLSPGVGSDLPGYKTPLNPANYLVLQARGIDPTSSLAREASEYKGGAAKGGGAAAYFRDMPEVKRAATASGLAALQSDIAESVKRNEAARAKYAEQVSGFNFSSDTGFMYDVPVGASAPSASVSELNYTPNFNPNFVSSSGELKEVSYTFKEVPVVQAEVPKLSFEERKAEESIAQNRQIRELVKKEFGGLPVVGDLERVSGGVTGFAESSFSGGDIVSQGLGGVTRLGGALISPYTYASPFLEIGLFATSTGKAREKIVSEGFKGFVAYAEARPIELGVQLLAIPVAAKGVGVVRGAAVESALSGIPKIDFGAGVGVRSAAAAGAVSGVPKIDFGTSAPKTPLVFTQEKEKGNLVLSKEELARRASFVAGEDVPVLRSPTAKQVSLSELARLQRAATAEKPPVDFKGLVLDERGGVRLSKEELGTRRFNALVSSSGELGVSGKPRLPLVFDAPKENILVSAPKAVVSSKLEPVFVAPKDLPIPKGGIDRPGYAYQVDKKFKGSPFDFGGKGGGGGGDVGKQSSSSGGAVASGRGQVQLVRFKPVEPKEKVMYFDVPKVEEKVVTRQTPKVVEMTRFKPTAEKYYSLTVLDYSKIKPKTVTATKSAGVLVFKSVTSTATKTDVATKFAKAITRTDAASATKTGAAFAFKPLEVTRTKTATATITPFKTFTDTATATAVVKPLSKTLTVPKVKPLAVTSTTSMFPNPRRLPPIKSPSFIGKEGKRFSRLSSKPFSKYSPSFVGIQLGKTVSRRLAGKNIRSNAFGVRLPVAFRGARF